MSEFYSLLVYLQRNWSRSNYIEMIDKAYKTIFILKSCLWSHFFNLISSVFLRSKTRQVISSLNLSVPELSSAAIESTIFFGEIVFKPLTILSTPSEPSSWPFFIYPSVTPSV